MKSYLQGIITGGVLVFATLVFIGAKKNGEVGRYTYHEDYKLGLDPPFQSMTIFDTKLGRGAKVVTHDTNTVYVDFFYENFLKAVEEEKQKRGLK